jgi:hypothetical protein
MTLSNEIKRVSDLNTNTKFPPSVPQSPLLDSRELEFAVLSLVGMLFPMAPHFVSELWQIWRNEVDPTLPERPVWPKRDETIGNVSYCPTHVNVMVWAPAR